MPIYAYRCAACGHAKDVLQKLADPALTSCPACGAEAFSKQLTAAGFQLKGSGWYATDFKGGSTAKSDADKPAKSDDKPSGDSTKAGAGGSGDTPPAAAGGCGASCACH